MWCMQCLYWYRVCKKENTYVHIYMQRCFQTQIIAIKRISIRFLPDVMHAVSALIQNVKKGLCIYICICPTLFSDTDYCNKEYIDQSPVMNEGLWLICPFLQRAYRLMTAHTFCISAGTAFMTLESIYQTAFITLESIYQTAFIRLHSWR